MFKLSVPLDTPLGGDGDKGRKAEFWTTPYPYWDMEKLDGELVKDFKESGLVIFKVRVLFELTLTRTELPPDHGSLVFRAT